MAKMVSLSNPIQRREEPGATGASWRSLLYPVSGLIVSLVIFLPRPGYAQSSVTAEARATEQISAQRTQEAGEDQWKFRWNDYPSLLLWNGTHVDFHLRMQGDLRSSDAPLDEGSPDDAARRRIGIAGDIAHHVRFEIERELSGDDPWRDVYVDYRQFAIVRLQAGRFKLPFSLDENTSATKLDFVNRSMAADALAPGRDRGVMVHGRPFGRTFKYELGVFEHDGANARTDNPHRVNGERTLAGRVTLTP